MTLFYHFFQLHNYFRSFRSVLKKFFFFTIKRREAQTQFSDLFFQKMCFGEETFTNTPERRRGMGFLLQFLSVFFRNTFKRNSKKSIFRIKIHKRLKLFKRHEPEMQFFFDHSLNNLFSLGGVRMWCHGLCNSWKMSNMSLFFQKSFMKPPHFVT